MAVYHFTVKIHARGKGASAVRAAAYRAAERLVDRRLGATEDYTRKADVVETAILLPEGAPAWMQDREELWNRVEARERRRDSQVAQELEINLPRELSDADNWRLITQFAREHLTAHGRICDIALHVHEAADGSLHPHAHVLMPLRQIAGDRFGEKHPDVDWRTFLNRRDRLGELRELWCSYARTFAAEIGHDLGPDWDHRSFAARDIPLESQPKVGATAQRRQAAGIGAERIDDLAALQRRNGEELLRRSGIVLEALTARQSTFTEADVARWIHRHAADDQFQGIYAGAKAQMVSVGHDDRDRERFSTPEMIALERTMIADAVTLAGRRSYVGGGSAVESSKLSAEQQEAARHLLAAGDVACLIGHAGAGKSTMLGVVREQLEGAGYRVRGAALSGIAAESLENGSGIESSTIASLRYRWEKDRDPLAAGDVLVVDEAGMVGSRELAALLAAAKAARAKVILVGDPAQLQAIEAGAAFRAIAERVGAATLTEIRRQSAAWQRDATRELAAGDMDGALARYRDAGAVHGAADDEAARQALVAGWARARADDPAASRIMLAHTRADVRALNDAARAELRAKDQLGDDVELATTRGQRHFARGDRLLFLRNERQLGVKNGTIGTVLAVSASEIRVRADDGRIVTVDPGTYQDIDHGFATTIHKSQGVTVDAAHLLATASFDSHLSYVGMTRHRHDLHLVYSRATFPSEQSLATTLGRERAKDTTLDYWDVADIGTKADLTFDPPPLTDLERAFIQGKHASPSLAEAFRLKRDRGPRLSR